MPRNGSYAGVLGINCFPSFPVIDDHKRYEKPRLYKYQRATYSGGMIGYIVRCAGDRCPPIFRSPIFGMKDIMDNQVICAIYRLLDAHKHITRPPAGVIFLKMVLSCHVLCLSLTFLLLVVYLLFLFLHSVSIYKASTCTDMHLCFCDKPLCVSAYFMVKQGNGNQKDNNK
ncbi:hypothetical protein ACSBR2_028892 [Camellia fascicularis]